MGSTKYPLIAPPGGGTPNLPGAGQPAPMRPDEFKPGSIANWTEFAFKGIDPPSSLYLQRDDQVLIQAASRTGGESVTFNFRWLRVPEPQGGQPSDAASGQPTGTVFDRGIVETRSELIKLPVAGAPVTSVLQFAEGYLLGAGAVCNLASFRGQTFARCLVLRGSAFVGQTTVSLYADYTTIAGPVGWPYGRNLNCVESAGWKHSFQVANPAAGADWIGLMAAQQRMRVESFAATFVASATVATRNIEIIVDDGANVVWRTSVPAGVTAGQTVSVSGTGSNQPTGIVATDFTILIPPGLILQPGWRLRSNTAAIQAGDQWSNIWWGVEEWLENV